NFTAIEVVLVMKMMEVTSSVSCGGCRKRRGETRMAGGGGGGGGSAGAAPKQDDTQPHPVKEQLPNISYCITSPPPWRTPPDRNRLQRPMAFRHKLNLQRVSGCRLLSPLSAAPLVALAGFGLYHLGFPGVRSLWLASASL
ncbi:hypothetical protein BHM03_00023012, partial [Ensete ventricosum]